MLPDVFVNYFVVDATPLLFTGDRNAYHAWRRELAELLEVDPASLHVVGSACVGFSLNPVKGLRDFSTDSDIDIAIVSNYHFDIAWRTLRQLVRQLLQLPTDVAASIRKHASRDVFNGCIATDKVLPVLPFAQHWVRAATLAQQSQWADGRAISFRLYRDLEGLRDYQVRGVQRLQEGLTYSE